MDIENKITETNNTDDKRSVILNVENEISDIQSFDHDSPDVFDACKIDVLKLNEVINKLPSCGKTSVIVQHIEKVLTKRELAFCFAKIAEEK